MRTRTPALARAPKRLRIYTMTTCRSERLKAFTASSETPSSVIKILMSPVGQITAGLVMPTLLESATMTTCLARLLIARKTAASSASMVAAPCSGSTPHTPMKTLSTTTALRDSIAVGPISEKEPGQRIQPPINVVSGPLLEFNSSPIGGASSALEYECGMTEGLAVTGKSTNRYVETSGSVSAQVSHVMKLARIRETQRKCGYPVWASITVFLSRCECAAGSGLLDCWPQQRPF
jgi:hypothetical protein